ncbi:replication-relaxation family protein [Metabacillus fastidiosus]|uniref:Replication-relaxation family protein n=1 Tax=Metabacillus fastidiosus TaxID=1458 RepID=A0ABU6NT29_9BACI|nr:replication-relaxation family protein [Metabacillus fastidiosus]
MRKRDRLIIEALEQFRALSRDQVAAMFYGHLKCPVTNANFALKRLRDRGYIEANTNMQPYVYFPKPSRIKQDGQKVAHFLKIADFYLQLEKAGGNIKFVHIEPQYMDNKLRPDMCVHWRGKVWFVEIQNSHYTHKVMNEKLKRYQTFYDSGEWKELPFAKKFPFVWIVADHKYKIEVDGFRVFQSKSVDDFLQQIEPVKPKEIKIVVG